MKKVLTLCLLVVSISCFGQTKKLKYQIVNSETDNRGLVNSLDVYISNMADIGALNKKLFDKYRNTGIVTFQIYYFDNMSVALKYKKTLFDKNASDEKLNKMYQHIIGKFEYNQFLKPSEKLKIGRDPEGM
jgi:hypothetical protein